MKSNRNQQGFSLIELAVSSTIILIISVILIGNFRTNDKSRRLNVAADGIINALRNAQNFTLAAKAIDASSCAPGGIVNKAPVNYRVMIDATTSIYTLTAEDNCGALYTIESYSLPASVRFRSNGLIVTTSGVPSNNNYIQVKFITPFAVSHVATSSGVSPTFNTFGTVDIVVEGDDGADSRTIIMDGISGRIGL